MSSCIILLFNHRSTMHCYIRHVDYASLLSIDLGPNMSEGTHLDNTTMRSFEGKEVQMSSSFLAFLTGAVTSNL